MRNVHFFCSTVVIADTTTVQHSPFHPIRLLRRKTREGLRLRRHRMYAKVRRVRNCLKVHYYSCHYSSIFHQFKYQHRTLNPQTVALFSLIHLPKTLIHPPKTLYPPLFTLPTFHSSSSSTSSSERFAYLYQFLPVFCSDSNLLSSVNSNERRRIVVGLSKLIKQCKGYAFKEFSVKFCPYLLVEIMKLLNSRETAFAFFKLAFQDHSKATVQASCIAAHILAAENFKFLAQAVVSWVIRIIGPTRSKDLVVEFMWENHQGYESEFSVLDRLMRAFLNVEMVSEALEILDRMRNVGVMPSSPALTTLFKLLLRVGDYGSVWKLFRGIIRHGPRPTCYNFNSMIHGFCREGYVTVGENLLYVMPKFHCQPDVYSYNILINAYCVRGQASDALCWVHLMIETACHPNIVTFVTFINGFCKEGNVVKARKLFDQIQEAGHSQNVEIYNALINGYVKARDIHQANLLYEEMRKKGVAPDGATINILVSGHYKYGRQEDGDRLLRDLSVSNFLQYRSVCDTFVASLCWAGQLDEAMAFLEEMLEKGTPISIIAFNSIIAAYSRQGLEENAYKVYNIMVKFGFMPSSSTCSSLLLGLSKHGKLQEARQLWYKMLKKGFPINKIAFTIILDGYFKIGDTVGAHSLWNEMKGRGMYPDAIAFSAFIDGLSKAGLVEEAYAVFLDMLRKGFVPNNFTYNSLIHGFCNCGKLQEALKLEKDMRQKGLLPDMFTINIIINGFCKEGRMKSAIDVFTDLFRTGLTPDIVTYNTLISGYCKAFDMASADDVINKMYASGWDPDITTYNIRIHGFSTSRKMSRAILLLDELISAGVVPNTVTYNIMMNSICIDILDRAMILTAKLLKMAFVPNIITTNVLLSHFCKQGMPEKALFWGQKLSEIFFDFDEVSYKLLDRAYSNIKGNADISRATSEKSLFLDFLMYITYDHFRRNRLQRKTSQDLH